MLKQFLAKHFGLVRLNNKEKRLIRDEFSLELELLKDSPSYEEWAKHFCSRLTALGISFTYNNRTGIK